MLPVELLLPVPENAAMLDHYSAGLLSAGMNPKYLFADILDALKVEVEFNDELGYLYSEIAFGDYVKYNNDKAGLDIQIEDLANVVKSTAKELYEIVSQRGFYNKEGILPYEFVRYDRGVFFLRHP